MPIPDWADQQLSKDLQTLRSQGENQDLEYIESFPKNARELGKEIAAFATSNQGTILIGVSDTGDLVGLSEGQTSEGRDELLRRIEGICSGTIRPSITPTVRFAQEDGKVALAIIVPRGAQPVYYSNGVPYVRHITASRPAEPHEVIELISTWLPSAASGQDADPMSSFLSGLAAILFEVLIYGSEASEREVNPWLDMWRAQFSSAAADLRSLATDDLAIKKNLHADLTELAQALDDVATLRLYMGCGPQLKALVDKVVQLAGQLKTRWIDPVPLSASSLRETRKTLTSMSRSLSGLVDRSEQMMNRGQVNEFQAEAATIGHTIHRVGHYNLDSLQAGLSEKLRVLGRRLHLIETMRTYMDGGRSIQAIVDAASQGGAELDEIVASIE